MGMFDTTGTALPQEQRKQSTLQKAARMKKALRHAEPDRVPISDFFWGGFIRRWQTELQLPEDANPYYYYDLDWIVTVPNMDPWIRSFETLEENQDQVVIKTGYGAIMRKVFHCPMPEFIGWETDSLEKLEAAEFDDPYDRRRYFSAGDNQMAGVGDSFERNSPPWVETVKSLWPDFPVYGSMVECAECMTRLIGPQNHMLWMAMEPERFGAVLNRVGQFCLDCAKAPIEAAGPWLDGFVIWGDVAYKRGTFMRPDYWREYYKPWVKAIVEHAHAKGLDVIYHGCGNVNAIFQDYIDDRHRRLQPPGGQSRHGRSRSAAALRTPNGLLRQQQHSGLGDGRPRSHPPRSPPQAQCRTRRRLHLPVRPFRVQLGLRPHLRLHRQARAGIRTVSSPARRVR